MSWFERVVEQSELLVASPVQRVQEGAHAISSQGAPYGGEVVGASHAHADIVEVDLESDARSVVASTNPSEAQRQLEPTAHAATIPPEANTQASSVEVPASAHAFARVIEREVLRDRVVEVQEVGEPDKTELAGEPEITPELLLKRVLSWVAAGPQPLRPESAHQPGAAEPGEATEVIVARHTRDAPQNVTTPTVEDVDEASDTMSEMPAVRRIEPVRLPAVHAESEQTRIEHEQVITIAERAEQRSVEEVVSVSIGSISVRIEAPAVPVQPIVQRSEPVQQSRPRDAAPRLSRHYLRP